MVNLTLEFDQQAGLATLLQTYIFLSLLEHYLWADMSKRD